MRLSHAILSIFALAAASTGGCDPSDPAPQEEAGDDRGEIGKADLAGTCSGACGGKSEGNCWCDDACADFGDCCADKVDVCEGGGSCEGENPAGCIETGCEGDAVCSTQTDACVASACDCDPATGQWQCTPDCGGGMCVDPDDDGGDACEGDNPAGCVATGCGEGETCATDVGGCVPSGCSCDSTTGTWLCTADCSGGVCVPDGAGACEGDNPAGCVSTGCGGGQICSTETDGCAPSACSCNEAAGTWDCTPDCGGGECVDAPACLGDNPAELCSDDPDACIPSACECDTVAMVWNCTPDCGGGGDCG